METFKAIILDIDGTLSPEVSWLALTRDLGASVEDHVAIYQSYKAGDSDYLDSKKQLLELWKATGNADHDYFYRLFDQLPLNEDVQNVVDKLKANYEICIITGSMDMYAEIVAQKLGVDNWFANTRLDWEHGVLVDMDYELDQASRKLEQFLGFCTANGYKPDECVVVGDGENDLLLFDVSNHGVLVGDDVPTEMVQRSWKIISNLKELPSIMDSLKT